MIEDTEEATEAKEEASEEPATEASESAVEVTEASESTEPAESAGESEQTVSSVESAEEPVSEESIPVVAESDTAIAKGAESTEVVAESSESSDDLLKASAGPEDLLDQLDQDVLTEELLEEEDEVEAEFEAGEYSVWAGNSWVDGSGTHYVHKYSPARSGMYSPYAWCLDHGKHDSSSWTWDGMQQLGSKTDGHKKAAALAWFNAGENSVERFKASQYVVWGYSSNSFSGDLKTYMQQIESLANRNSQFHDIDNGEQIGKLKKIAEDKIGTASAAYYKQLDATVLGESRTYTYKPENIEIKRAIKQGFLKPAKKDGKYAIKLGGASKVAKVTVKSVDIDTKSDEPSITWNFSGKWDKNDPERITVYLEMSGDTYVGSKVGVLEPTGKGNQRFAIGTEGVKDYFCIGVETPKVKKDEKFPTFWLNKADPDGGHVAATFEVRYSPWGSTAAAHGVTAPQLIPGSEFDSGSYDANGNWVPHVVDMGELWDSMQGADMDGDEGTWFHEGTDEPKADGHYYVYETSVSGEFLKKKECVFEFCLTSREVTEGTTKIRYYGMYNIQKDKGSNKYVYAMATSSNVNAYTLIQGYNKSISGDTMPGTVTVWGDTVDAGVTTGSERKNTGKSAGITVINEHYHAGAEFFKQQYVMTQARKAENGDIVFDWDMQGAAESRFILRADSDIYVNGVKKYNKDQIIYPKYHEHISTDNADVDKDGNETFNY